MRILDDTLRTPTIDEVVIENDNNIMIELKSN